MTAMNIQSELYAAFDSDPRQITGFLPWLVSSYGIAEPCRVLDIGCGPGKMLAEYSRLQWPVVGMEPDQDYFEHATRIAQTNVNVVVRKGGFADIDYVNAFHIITAINDPFAHLLTIDGRKDALGRSFASLNPGGILFIDVANFPFILKNYRPPAETALTVNGKKIKRIPEHSLDFHNNLWIHTDRFYETGNEHLKLIAEKVHKYAMLNLPEVLYLMKMAGFIDFRTYNSYASRKSETITGNRIMISARKP